MLDSKYLESLLSKLRLDSFDFQMTGRDPSSNYMTFRDTENDFMVLKQRLQANPFLSRKIVDNGYSFLELEDVVYDDGNKVYIRVRFEAAGDTKGLGCLAHIAVKRIQTVIGGKEKIFLGYDDMESYREKIPSAE